MKRFITELGFDEIAAAFVTRPLRVPAVVLRSANDDAPAVAVVPGFGKVGTLDEGPTPQFVKTKFELKPYTVNLDKLLSSGNNLGDVQDPDPGRDGAPSR